MVKILPFRSFFYQSAYTCSILGCMTKNELVVRCLQLIGTVCFMLEGIITIDIGADLVSATCLMCCFSIYYIFRIIRRSWPLKFTEQLEALYSHVFADSLTRFEFSLLLKDKVIKVKEARVSGTQLQLTGNHFKSVIILGDLPDTNVALTFGPIVNPEDVLVKHMKPWSWIGCIEFIESMQGGPNLNKTTLFVTHTMAPFTYYKIHIKRLVKVFEDKHSGMSIQNAFYMKMLGYLADRLYIHDRRYLRARSIMRLKSCGNLFPSILEALDEA